MGAWDQSYKSCPGSIMHCCVESALQTIPLLLPWMTICSILEEIHLLLKKLEQGYDVVYGNPATEQHGLWRDAASQITKLALRSTMGVSTARKVSAFRAFNTNLRDAFAGYQGPYVSIDVLLTWGTDHFTSVEVHHNPRQVGQSNYTFRKLVSMHKHDNRLQHCPSPPCQHDRIFIYPFWWLILIYVIGRYLIQGDSVPGFPFLASIIALFSGAQLFALGILGGYFSPDPFSNNG